MDETLSIPNPNTIRWKNNHDRPNFSLAQEFELPGTKCSDGKAYVVPSKNGNWRYIFYMNKAENDFGKWREKEEHPTLAAVEWIGEGQSLTDFGTRSIVADPHGTDMPFIEYKNQLSQKTYNDYIENSKNNLEDFEGQTYEMSNIDIQQWPTWFYRQQIPVLKEFQSWRISQSEKMT